VKWGRRAHVWAPSGAPGWQAHSALQPTPLARPDGTIRVFTGIRDADGVSRVGWVDVDGEDPTRVVEVSREPALDIGAPGRFDDNGVVPCALVALDGELRLYYAGYQLVQKAKFLVFGGLASSRDGGASFARVRTVPVLDRTDDEPLFRVAHTVRPEGGRFRAWYGGGGDFVESGGNVVPRYDIRYIESDDGIAFPESGERVIPLAPGEHRLGRPYVIEAGGRWRMFYGISAEGLRYRLGYAESEDGRTWTRRDDELGLAPSAEGWDSTMVAYPGVVRSSERWHLFYNGNDMGRTGFGVATLEAW
jgi:hypothetical protein